MSDDGDAAAAARQARAMTRQALRPPSSAAAAPASRAAPPPRRRRTAIPILAAGLCLGSAAGLVAILHRPPTPAATQPATRPPIPSLAPAAPAALPIPVATEAEILAAATDRQQLFRLAGAPQVLVLAFASMHLQAQALNRIGAYVEKSAAPRDRVLDDAELAQVIAAGQDSADGYYYGHDYAAATLQRFYDAATVQGVMLNPDERALHALLDRTGLLAPGANAALITLPPLSASPAVDAAARATILRHEVSHGIYFTDPAYAAATAAFWQQTMTAAQRAAFRRFLAGEGYDTGNDDLMRNETQAYLVHTADPRFFTAAAVHLPPEQVAALRARFVADMPPGWLRDHTPAR